VAAHVFSATEEGAGMTEFIEPEIAKAIRGRAKGKCECENLRCKHVAGICRNGLNAKSGIVLPLVGAETPVERLAEGRAVCRECFQRSDSAYRQQRY
jgi:hypothetical protein